MNRLPKKAISLVLLVAALGSGAFAARGDSVPEPRKIKLKATERLAIQETQRRGADLDASRKRLDEAYQALRADTAAIISEVRSAYAIDATDGLELQPDGTLVVTPAPAQAAPVTSAPPQK